MTLDRVRDLTKTQVQLGGRYNHNAVRLFPGEVDREQGQGAVDALIRELDLEQVFGDEPGTDFSGLGREPLADRGSKPPPAFA
jgi:hypothetical protein